MDQAVRSTGCEEETIKGESDGLYFRLVLKNHLLNARGNIIQLDALLAGHCNNTAIGGEGSIIRGPPGTPKRRQNGM
jgi:hypothetical protein